MDPNATLAVLIDAACQPARSPEHARQLAEDIRHAADDLATWIARGGFAPTLPKTLADVEAS